VKKQPPTTVIATVILFGLAIVGFAAPYKGFRNIRDFWGPRYRPARGVSKSQSHAGPHGAGPANRIRHWNEIAINASGLDHTPVAIGENRTFGEQLGPARSSRAMAIVHIAVFEAVNTRKGRFKSYCGIDSARRDASMECAIAQAACDSLGALFPSQKAAFDQELASELNEFPDNRPKADGIALGHRAAAAILALRANDGSQHEEPCVAPCTGTQFVTSNAAGKWRKDPISRLPIALGAHWSFVQPFVLQSSAQFRAPPPQAINSPEYAAAFNEVKSVGGDGLNTPTSRTDEQTHIGIFWAYDGTPSLCAPPRLYNQIAMHIAHQMGTSSDPADLARLLALINVAMADAGSAIWESKYYYQYWRPVTGIRESDVGTGPTGAGDGNPATVGDPTFSPLGAPASNLNGPDFTPPFPAYPSGHGGFGAALFETLRNFYGTDQIAFTFTSDEFNGVTRDNDGTVRPLLPRNFSSLSEAEEENGQSRIYLGIHWSFDKTEAIAQGRRVADYVFANAFVPLPKGKPHGK
jgi:hypothetical protein